MIDIHEMQGFFKQRQVVKPSDFFEKEMQTFMKSTKIELTQKTRKELDHGVDISSSDCDPSRVGIGRSEEVSSGST